MVVEVWKLDEVNDSVVIGTEREGQRHGYGTVKQGQAQGHPGSALVRENRSACACSDQLTTLNLAVALQHVDIFRIGRADRFQFSCLHVNIPSCRV